MYLTASRLDIIVVKRIFKYLNGTPRLCLDLKGYSESDYAGCNMDRKRTLGDFQLLGGKLSQLSDYDIVNEKDAKKLLETVEKTFGGNAATKKTQRNLLKQQYENFTASSLEMLDQTFDRLQKLVSQLELLEEKLSQEDVNQKLLRILVSCDGLGGYDWSDQAEEEPNYALMAFLSSSSDLEVLQDRFRIVEERLKFYKTNESIYFEDINVLKVEIQIEEIAIRELRKKLEITQKEKDGIQLNVDKLKHASKSLNKLMECQIVDNCKKMLGYENYNAVPPPYTGNFMPPTLDLYFTSLDEFVNKHVAENCKAKSSEEEPKVVRKNDDALIIEE
nr:hypothetical protein [Tanacetum cinerariifolium]